MAWIGFAWLLFRFSPYPVGHAAHEHGKIDPNSDCQSPAAVQTSCDKKESLKNCYGTPSPFLCLSHGEALLLLRRVRYGSCCNVFSNFFPVRVCHVDPNKSSDSISTLARHVLIPNALLYFSVRSSLFPRVPDCVWHT